MTIQQPYTSSTSTKANMDMLYCRMLEVFEDGELHTYKECWEKTLKDRYPLGWNKGSFNGLWKRGFIRHVDNGGPNRSYRYQISEDGLKVLETAKTNQKVFKFLRHFKDKNKDDYFTPILNAELAGEDVSSDLSPESFLAAVDALCSDDTSRERETGNYAAYSNRIWKLIEKTDALDEILADPVVLDTLIRKAKDGKSSMERCRYFDYYNHIKSALEWREMVKKSREQHESEEHEQPDGDGQRSV